MTPVMAAGVEAQNGGYIADLDDAGSALRLPETVEVAADAPRWDLERIQAREAWQISGGAGKVPVAVLDTGIDAAHPELKGKVVGGKSFTRDSGIDLLRGHGTHLAGIIAAAAGDGGITGLAYGCRLLDVQVAENDGRTDARKLADGIIWAADQGARVLNVSIVINQPYPLLEYAVDYAWEKGCIIIAAAGKPKTVTGDMVKDGVTIIDVGVNEIGKTAEGKRILVGDVDFESVKEKARAITPVPGGVGPMTITMLMMNTVKAVKKAHNIK